MPSGNGQPRIYDLTNPAEVPAGSVRSRKLLNELRAAVPLVGNQAENIVTIQSQTLEVYFPNILSGPETTSADLTVFNHVPIALSQGFQFWEENLIQSTQLETYQDFFTRTSQPLAEGMYIISWQCEIRVNPTGPLNSAAQGRVQVNGNTKNLMYWQHLEWTTISGWDRQRFDEAETAELVMQFRRDPGEGGNDTVDVRRMKLGIELKE